LTTDGGKKVNAALALPAKTPAPAVLLVHEWWGLNDQIKAVAADLAHEGYAALAIDLYDGKVATVPDGARSYMGAVKADEAKDTVGSWARWLKKHAKGNGKIATVGWCFGGSSSLMTGIAEPVDGTIVYYGKVDRSAAMLENLKGPVLGHYATQDQWINQAMVDKFEAAMQEAGKPYTSHWYDAQHAFANPSSGRYDKEDAQLSWKRTLEFLGKTIGS
jgi:carboxymethylenebutenolidase